MSSSPSPDREKRSQPGELGEGGREGGREGEREGEREGGGGGREGGREGGCGRQKGEVCIK